MATLHYIHDPMCSWCYAFAPVWERIQAALPANVRVEYVLGGLAPDTDEPMPAPMRDHIQQTWNRIRAAVPGTVFNFDFWTRGTPRRATY
ncbi:MAG TPA: DsbA family protein, partial [Gammaproteobacteria bacterium]|nr:DsbA family protein [Gammaproteobacteria bacterium]